jgi:hypothetical protein
MFGVLLPAARTSVIWKAHLLNGRVGIEMERFPEESALHSTYAPKHYNAIFHEWVGISRVSCKQTEEVDLLLSQNDYQLTDFPRLYD